MGNKEEMKEKKKREMKENEENQKQTLPIFLWVSRKLQEMWTEKFGHVSLIINTTFSGKDGTFNAIRRGC